MKTDMKSISLDEAIARILANHGMSTTSVHTIKLSSGDAKTIGLICNENGQTFEMTVTETTEVVA